VAWTNAAPTAAHDGAILCAAAHPSGDGVITGGDDGRLVWSRRGGAQALATLKNRWIDAVAVSPVSGLVAFASGREVQVLDVKDAAFARRFSHAASVAALAFDPKGRRLAAATYGGAALWYARIADQTPVMLRWAGSHIAAVFSPDGKFLISSMQEGALHGWRLSDAMDMRMGGYPSKARSLAFIAKGAWLATSGAQGAVVWPFGGSQGPMGKQAMELGYDQTAMVTRVAGDPATSVFCAGLDDGRVWVCDLENQAIAPVKSEKGEPISALAMTRDAIAWGDEAGGAGVVAR
jgi:WD40 repeat protein